MVWKEWVQMKNSLVTAEAVYIYSVLLQRVESVYSTTYTDASLKKGFVHFAYNRFVVGVLFCTQNLIRDG